MNKLTKVANAKSSSILMEIVCAGLVIILVVGGWFYVTMQVRVVYEQSFLTVTAIHTIQTAQIHPSYMIQKYVSKTN